MDILSDVLQTLKLRGTVYFHARFHAPWGMKIPSGQFANFHIVTDGDCWLETGEGKPTVKLSKGDVAIFAHGTSHALLYEPGAPTVQAQELLSAPKEEDREHGVAFGGQGSATTSLICGHFEYDKELPHPLFDTLSPCIHIKAGEHESTRWIATASELAANISTTDNNPAADAVVDRLAEALFIQALAAHIQSMDDCASFLVAVQDRNIGKALNMMHSDIAHDWTLDELARVALMSRSVFAEKFRRLVGESPMLYLARWRMLKARELLVDTKMAICEISGVVGYQSEFAFSKAFKKLLGTSPSLVRKSAGVASTT